MRRPALLASLGLSLSCADARPGPGPNAPEVLSAAPTSTPPKPNVAPPVDDAKPEPPRAVSLRVAIEGRTNDLQLSVVDGEVFAHGETDLVRLGPNAEVAERLSYPDKAYDTTEISAVVGRWPDPLYLSVHRGERGDSQNGAELLVRRDGKWRDVEVFGRFRSLEYDNTLDMYVEHAWPWFDGSILALAHGNDYRFGVVRGAPKAPKLAAFNEVAKRSCVAEPIAVAVHPRGDVVALINCRHRDATALDGTWLAHWYRNDAPKVHPLSKDLADYFPYDGDALETIGPAAIIADDGTATVAFVAGDQAHVFAETAAGPVERGSFPGPVVALARGPDGDIWLATDHAIQRGTAKQWHAEFETKHQIRSASGLGLGAPWLALDDNTVWRRSGDDWQQVALPESTFFPGHALEPRRVVVLAPDQAFVLTSFDVLRRRKMDKMRPMKTEFRALLTTREVGVPLRFGPVVEGREEVAFEPWPPGSGHDCKQRLVLLMRLARWERATRPYPAYQRAIRGKAGLELLRHVELELGGQKLMAAFVDDDVQAAAAMAAVNEFRDQPTEGEVVCADAATLAGLGATVHRELNFASDQGK